MKTQILLGTVVMLAAGVVRASVYEYNFNGASTINATIPDGNPGGYASTLNVSGLGIQAGEDGIVLDVNVYLNISGGYNGDLFGYLVNPNGNIAILLNRIGRDGTFTFGNNGGGIVVILDDSGSPNIHTATFGSVSGAYAPDGRMINPLTVVTGDDATQGTLANLNGTDGNGTWTLFLADLSGGETSQLVSWGLQINVGPEPTTWALIGFASMAGMVALVRICRGKLAMRG